MSTPAGREPTAPVLPEQTADDSDRGWGDRPEPADPDDLERFLQERPPHHGD